jgi:hypothetical protein
MDGGQEMSRLTTGILAAIALSLTFGAAQFALGRDLPEATQDHALPEPMSSSMSSAGGINRAAKADRAARPVGSPLQTQTISLRLGGFADTSFLVRVPVAAGAGNPSTSPGANNRKPMVACEPVVSMLTEVAKLLQPGRCVT